MFVQLVYNLLMIVCVLKIQYQKENSWAIICFKRIVFVLVTNVKFANSSDSETIMLKPISNIRNALLVSFIMRRYVN